MATKNEGTDDETANTTRSTIVYLRLVGHNFLHDLTYLSFPKTLILLILLFVVKVCFALLKQNGLTLKKAEPF